MDLLAQDPIRLPFGNIEVPVPRPANYAIHKLLIAGRRKDKKKAEKDRSQAVAILAALETTGEFERARGLYGTLPKKWQGTLMKELTELGEKQLVNLLSRS